MKTAAYVIRCLTNLHVGVGGANYDIVDNVVQRDVTTQLPCIYSSSLKGALRQFCADRGKVDVDHIFGHDQRDRSEKQGELEHSVGKFTFFQGYLLAYPIQTENGDYSYELVHDENQTAYLDWLAEMLGIKDLGIKDLGIKEVKKGDLKEATKYLPVIARNKLENGESKNLWYEEVVPAESRFVFFVTYDDEDKFKAFDGLIRSEPVQIGANGSIGYGFCNISRLDKDGQE